MILSFVIITLLTKSAFGIPGEPSVGPATAYLKKQFYTALIRGNYTKPTDPFVCTTHFGNVTQQVVAGINYKFRVVGCPVNSRKEIVSQNRCPCLVDETTEYDIHIFVQAWTGIYEVQQVVVIDPPYIAVPTAPLKKLYYKAIMEGTYPDNAPFICVTIFDGVDKKVIGGAHYRFHVLGCPVESKKDITAPKKCPCVQDDIDMYVLRIFVKKSTSTYEVQKVSMISRP